MANRRVLEIIRILLQQKNYITIQSLAGLLQVSGKTVRNDLKEVSDLLSENGLTLVKKTGVGIFIEGTETQKLRAMDTASDNIRRRRDYSPEARRIYIGLRLITYTDNCRIYELANELYVSRATIHKDLLSLSERIAPYRVELIRKNNNGVQISGKERSLRDLMFDLMQEDKGYDAFIRIVQDNGYVCGHTFVYEALDYTDNNLYDFVRLILSAGNTFISALPFRSLLAALLRIFISLIRIIDGHIVILSTEFMADLEREPLYLQANEVAGILEENYQIVFPEEERRYLQIHFLSLHNQEETPSREKEESLEITDRLLSHWEKLFNRPFTQDRALREALASHLEPAINRFRHGIHIENPLMYEIKTYYKHTFEIARESMRLVEERYQCKLSDDETGYIAVHLAAALDRMKVPLNTLLVSHCGTGATNLLVRKLSTQIPEISIVSMESFLSIQSASLNGIDLILSTLDLKLYTQIPILVINTLLYDADLIRLKETISVWYKQKNDPLKMIRRNVD